ncbi:MAG: carboxypeptidase regulatory-like domain-containing protein [Acidobacteriota bacterium]
MWRSTISLVFVSGLALSNGWSQQFRSTLNGQVVDPQGAVVPGVQIVATRVVTGAKFTTVSGDAGQYTAPFLPPGTYTITAEVAGFKRYVREGVQVSTNQRVALDISLEVGGVAEAVTVSSDAPMLVTATASVGQVITTRQLDTMPLSGRAPMSMARLSYGVADMTNPQKNNRPFDNSGTSSYSMGGGQNRSNELLLDGAPNLGTDRVVAYNPPLDAVQEVKVEFFQADAAYGNTAGGTVNVVTKGGTNQFHGTAGEFNQVSKLAATPFFTNMAGQKKPVTRYNQWGVTAGAPVIIPRVFNGTNKAFWHFGYDAIKQGLPAPFTVTVPAAAMRTGNFSELLPLGSVYQLYDPLTAVAEGDRRRRQPFAGNVVPPNRINGVAKNFLPYYPLPNQPGRSNGQDNYLANSVDLEDFSSYLGRVDLSLSDRHKLFWNIRENYRYHPLDDLFDNKATGTDRVRGNWGSMLDDVYTFNPTTLLNTRLAWNRYDDADHHRSEGFDITSLGFPASIAAASLRPMIPVLDFSDSTEKMGSSRITVPGAGFATKLDNFQIFSTLNKVISKHSIKFGADLRMQRQSTINYANSAGSYQFNTNWVRGPLDTAAGAANGQSLASLLLGLPTGGGFDLNAHSTIQAYYAAFFIHDDWRARPDLTVNVGLRYERETGTVERFNRALAGFDFTSPNAVTAPARAAYAARPIPELPASAFNPVGGTLFAGPNRRNIYGTDSNVLSPRLGLAYTPARLGGKTVFRSGFGIFFATYGATGLNQPGFSQTTPVVATLDGYLTPYATLSNPFPGGIQQPVGAADGLNTYLGRSITYFNPNLAQPYSLRWIFSIQQQLSQNLMWELGYAGSHALHLTMNRNLNFTPRQFLSTSPVRDQATINRLTANVANPFQGLAPGTGLNGSTTSVEQLLLPLPQLPGLTVQSLNEGNSNYHALQARLEKRLSNGLQFLVNYNFSRLIEANRLLNPTDLQPERRVADEDRPHRLVLSSSYDLPFGKGRRLASGVSSWMNRLIGGWSVTGVWTVQSGSLLGWGNVIYYGGDLDLNPRNVQRAFDTTRFNTVAAQQLDRNVRTFNSAFGNLRADRPNNFDTAVLKNTPIREKVSLQFRFETFNTLNRPQLGGPQLSPTSASFARITSQANSPRAIQMALRLIW